MKPLQIGELASAELADAVRWYEQRRPGWGARLLDAAAQAFESIERQPEIGSLRKSRPAVRQLVVRGFPYSIVYRTTGETIYVIAVAHTRRRPGYGKAELDRRLLPASDLHRLTTPG